MLNSSLSSDFPIEIVHEIIRNSDVLTLANWCLVSRAFLSFAGPLLHETVVLTRPQDMIPFLDRLRTARSSSPPSSSSSLLLAFVKDVQRLEILALSPKPDALDLFNHPSLPSNSIVLGISWRGQDEVDMANFWVPVLLAFVQPQKYEDLGRDEPIYLSGPLLFLYRRDVSRRFELAPQIYETMRELAGEQAAWKKDVDGMKAADVRAVGGSNSELLDSLVLVFEERRGWFEGNWLLGPMEKELKSFEDFENHYGLQKVKFKELLAAYTEMREEEVKLLQALIEAHKANPEILDTRRRLQNEISDLQHQIDTLLALRISDGSSSGLGDQSG